MTQYIRPAEGQSFAQAISEALAKPHKKTGRPVGSRNRPKVEIVSAEPTPVEQKSKRIGRPVGSKNKPGHKAGRKDMYLHSPLYKAYVARREAQNEQENRIAS